jgi:alpha-tubulin suppressor-like RCC1 family protein
MIEHGDAYVCGLDNDQLAWCWGANNGGKLGIGTEEYHQTPQAVSGGHRFTKLSGFYTFLCGIDTSGRLLCWGNNQNGQIDDAKVSRLVPTTLNTVLRFRDVSVGSYHACAITTDGAWYCWGDMGAGASFPTGSSQLIQFGAGQQFTAVASGGNFACAITTDRTVACIGASFGSTPRAISGLSDVARIDAFSGNACALTSDRSLYCWGDNAFSQLGVPVAQTPSNWSQGLRVAGLSDVTSIGGAYTTPCAVTSAGSVFCWGYNGNGEAGQPLPRIPRVVSGGLTFWKP